MIQASISPSVPSVGFGQGTVKWVQPTGAIRSTRAEAGSRSSRSGAPSSATTRPGRSTSETTITVDPPRWSQAVIERRPVVTGFGGADPVRVECEQVAGTPVLRAREQITLGGPHRADSARGHLERPVQPLGHPSPRPNVEVEHTDADVLRIGERVVVAKERDARPVEGDGGERATFTPPLVRRSTAAGITVGAWGAPVEIGGEVDIPARVASRGDDQRRRVR